MQCSAVDNLWITCVEVIYAESYYDKSVLFRIVVLVYVYRAWIFPLSLPAESLTILWTYF